MRNSFLKVSCLAAAALGFAAGVDPASAACKRLGFTVNDYGKDGPTRDAKSLLDKHIAKFASEHGIAKYTTGKKDVTCELFLNLILFDEHTCTAEATVCWDGPAVKGAQEAKSETPATDGAAEKPKASAKAAKPADGEAAPEASKAAAKTEAKSEEKAAKAAAAPAETGSTSKPAEAPAAAEAAKDAVPAAAQ
jgi:hypothetical protein